MLNPQFGNFDFRCSGGCGVGMFVGLGCVRKFRIAWKFPGISGKIRSIVYLNFFEVSHFFFTVQLDLGGYIRNIEV